MAKAGGQRAATIGRPNPSNAGIAWTVDASATLSLTVGMGAKEQATDPNARRYEVNREMARFYTQSLIRFLATKGLMPPAATAARLTGIDDKAIEIAAKWSFPWQRIMGQARPYYRRFEVALWIDDNLCGLSVGRSSRGPDNVTIHFLERAAEDNPFMGFFSQIALDTADRYAKLIGRQRVKLKNPNPALVPKYQSLGFSVAETRKGNTYYDRQV